MLYHVIEEGYVDITSNHWIIAQDIDVAAEGKYSTMHHDFHIERYFIIGTKTHAKTQSLESAYIDITYKNCTLYKNIRQAMIDHFTSDHILEKIHEECATKRI